MPWERVSPSSSHHSLLLFLIQEEGSFLCYFFFFLTPCHVGQKHSFNYWETEDTQTPIQFQGPVLEFWPYGQSMMRWENVVTGLNGLPLETEIFYIPDNCSYIPADKFLLSTNTKPAFRALFLHHMSISQALR